MDSVWSRQVDGSGREYFVNSETGESAWELPSDRTSAVGGVYGKLTPLQHGPSGGAALDPYSSMPTNTNQPANTQSSDDHQLNRDTYYESADNVWSVSQTGGPSKPKAPPPQPGEEYKPSGALIAAASGLPPLPAGVSSGRSPSMRGPSRMSQPNPAGRRPPVARSPVSSATGRGRGRPDALGPVARRIGRGGIGRRHPTAPNPPRPLFDGTASSPSSSPSDNTYGSISLIPAPSTAHPPQQTSTGTAQPAPPNPRAAAMSALPLVVKVALADGTYNVLKVRDDSSFFELIMMMSKKRPWLFPPDLCVKMSLATTEHPLPPDGLVSSVTPCDCLYVVRLDGKPLVNPDSSSSGDSGSKQALQSPRLGSRGLFGRLRRAGTSSDLPSSSKSYDKVPNDGAPSHDPGSTAALAERLAAVVAASDKSSKSPVTSSRSPPMSPRALAGTSPPATGGPVSLPPVRKSLLPPSIAADRESGRSSPTTTTTTTSMPPDFASQSVQQVLQPSSLHAPSGGGGGGAGHWGAQGQSANQPQSPVLSPRGTAGPGDAPLSPSMSPRQTVRPPLGRSPFPAVRRASTAEPLLRSRSTPNSPMLGVRQRREALAGTLNADMFRGSRKPGSAARHPGGVGGRGVAPGRGRGMRRPTAPPAVRPTTAGNGPASLQHGLSPMLSPRTAIASAPPSARPAAGLSEAGGHYQNVSTIRLPQQQPVEEAGGVYSAAPATNTGGLGDGPTEAGGIYAAAPARERESIYTPGPSSSSRSPITSPRSTQAPPGRAPVNFRHGPRSGSPAGRRGLNLMAVGRRGPPASLRGGPRTAISPPPSMPSFANDDIMEVEMDLEDDDQGDFRSRRRSRSFHFSQGTGQRLKDADWGGGGVGTSGGGGGVAQQFPGQPSLAGRGGTVSRHLPRESFDVFTIGRGAKQKPKFNY